MAGSWFTQFRRFKSPVRVVAAVLLRSRETQAQRAREKPEEVARLRRVNEQQQRPITRLEQDLADARLQARHLEVENSRLRQQPPVLPDDPRLPHHEFGAKMIALCVNLARTVGLRPCVRCLKIVFEWLGVSCRIPDWTTVRTWLMRVGVAAIEEPVEPADDWIWMADHSNQIGPEKALVVLGLRASQMPPPGTPLTHANVRTLLVQPGTNWKREDMADAYEQLAARVGVPRAVLVDGAVELREGADVLKTQRTDSIVLRDFKHYAANVLKKIVGGDARFAEVLSHIGRTRSAIQQTELAHLTPPGKKPKARFMNMAATLKWASMVLWHLSHPHSNARREMTTARMNEKLGWLRKYRDDIERWLACQSVVSASLTFINEQAVFRGAADTLAAVLHPLRTCDQAVGHVADRLIEFVRTAEQQLVPGERLPLSTEILESSFGLFKQLEGQHSKGGFTSLLASFGALLKPATADSIREDFARVPVSTLRAWVRTNLKTTLAAKRNAAYTEFAKTA